LSPLVVTFVTFQVAIVVTLKSIIRLCVASFFCHKIGRKVALIVTIGVEK